RLHQLAIERILAERPDDDGDGLDHARSPLAVLRMQARMAAARRKGVAALALLGKKVNSHRQGQIRCKAERRKCPARKQETSRHGWPMRAICRSCRSCWPWRWRCWRP